MNSDDFGLKRELDALPRAIEPPDDLWPGVRSRIQRRGTGDGKRETGSSRPWALGGRGMRIAALLTLMAVSAAALAITRRDAATWRLAAGGEARRFTVGESLATGAAHARLTVGTIGTVELDPATRVRLLAARATEHRLGLERGTLHAEISAPPRLFVVETPSGTAIDLGCAYTLTVDSAGNSTIVVTAGWVAFEDGGRSSLIPAGMRAATRRGGGIGTPVMEDAADSLKAALAAFDSGSGGEAALATILRIARARDAVSLWHLVSRTSGEARGLVVERLAVLAPLPADLPITLIQQADPRALELYWTTLPGTLPIIPAWQRKVWMMWLRVMG